MRLPLLCIVVALGASVAVDLWLDVDPPAYGAGVGLVGVIVLTFGSKLLAAVLKRPGDYYEHIDLPPPEPEEAGSD